MNTSDEKKSVRRTLVLDGGVQGTIHHLHFGRYTISKKNLDKGILSVSYANCYGRPSTHVLKNNKSVSPMFVNMMYDILLDDKEIDPRKYFKLSTDEQRLTKILFRNAGLFHHLRNVILDDKQHDDEEQEVVNRFELIRGSILAGNNNPELLDELETLLQKLVEYDILTHVKARRILTTILKTKVANKV